MHHLKGLKFKSLQSGLFFIHHHGYKRTVEVQASDITSMPKQAGGGAQRCTKGGRSAGRERREGARRAREMNQEFSGED